MSMKKNDTPSEQSYDSNETWNQGSFPEGMGIFPEDVSFPGIGCGKKGKKSRSNHHTEILNNSLYFSNPNSDKMLNHKLIDGHPHLRYSYESVPEQELVHRSHEFYTLMQKRRSIREFDSRPVPIGVLEQLIRTAGTAPSGANKQPWTFCLVSSPSIKREIRLAAEQEERQNYASRMSENWKQDLKPLGTDWEKPLLEEAPYLIVVFKQSFGTDGEEKIQHYYVNESVGIACGILIAAIHQAGLVTLTHTPSPMNFLSKILRRPAHEKPYLLLPVGYPKEECYVPAIQRKKLDEILIHF